MMNMLKSHAEEQADHIVEFKIYQFSNYGNTKLYLIMRLYSSDNC